MAKDKKDLSPEAQAKLDKSNARRRKTAAEKKADNQLLPVDAALDQDFDADFDDEAEVETKVVPSESTDMNISFPAGTDPEIIKNVMASVSRLTADVTKAAKAISEGRKVYIKQCKRRFKCIVQSNRPGWDHFELIVSNPFNDQPVPVRGRCGVILEAGLTQYVINELNNTHDYRTEKGRSMTIEQILSTDAAMVLDHKAVKQYHYRVDILEEVENPIPVGNKVGSFK